MERSERYFVLLQQQRVWIDWVFLLPKGHINLILSFFFFLRWTGGHAVKLPHCFLFCFFNSISRCRNKITPDIFDTNLAVFYNIHITLWGAYWWKTASLSLWQCLRTLVGHTGGVWSSQMRDNIIISGSTDRTLKVWNAETGECIHTLYGHTSTVRCMHLHEKRYGEVSSH